MFSVNLLDDAGIWKTYEVKFLGMKVATIHYTLILAQMSYKLTSVSVLGIPVIW